MNRWQTITDMEVNQGKPLHTGLRVESLSLLAQHCSEFLIHAADVEGLCRGIDEELVTKLGEWTTIPTTYAGGGKSLRDLALVNTLSNGKVDLTIGSALDLFGGTGVKFNDCIEWNTQT
jgi:phosphoribosylformimino-5-aminoimidazole carboxamide ribotide isomerase